MVEIRIRGSGRESISLSNNTCVFAAGSCQVHIKIGSAGEMGGEGGEQRLYSIFDCNRAECWFRILSSFGVVAVVGKYIDKDGRMYINKSVELVLVLRICLWWDILMLLDSFLKRHNNQISTFVILINSISEKL